jgi:hypothetical protein
MFFGTAEITSEPNGPSLLEASLKEKRNNVHDRSPRSGSPQLVATYFPDPSCIRKLRRNK